MYKELEELSKSDFYPFHMPGHKRQPSGLIFDAAFSFDITEIDDFDNMHHPEGIIKKLQDEMAGVFRADEAKILVNGSSAGILAAISAAVKRNGKIIMARNSHKSAYNAAMLRGLDIRYIYPEYIAEYAMNGGIDPNDVKRAIDECPEAEAVFITSPTYEGILSDIEAIAEICHSREIPLIVDSAHGAHFGLNEKFDRKFGIEPAIKYADASIISLHKTLPVFTQTAALLTSGKRIDYRKISEFCSVYQTSSPSYLFMAAVDNCLNILRNEGEERFEKLLRELSDLRKEKYENITIVGENLRNRYSLAGYDGSKLCISARGMTGRELYDILRSSYHLQGEMASLNYCLFMTGIMDTEDAFIRLKTALREIDECISNKNAKSVKTNKKTDFNHSLFNGDARVKIQDAVEENNFEIKFEEADGRTAASWVYAYPPDIPLIVPGEKINSEMIEEIIKWKKDGINIIGVNDGEFRVLG